MHDERSIARRVRFGGFELDVRSGELRKGATRLKVPDKSIEILRALLEQPGELVTRDALRDRLWPGNTFVDFEHGLNAAVRRLRDALGDSAETPRFIETLPRRGYRFVGTIADSLPGGKSDDQLNPAVGTSSSDSLLRAPEPTGASGASSRGESSPEPERSAARARRGERLAWLAAGTLAIALVVTLMLMQRPPHGPGESTQLTIGPPAGAQFGPTPQFAVSPDGRLFVFVAQSENSRQLWLKARSSPVVNPLPDTGGASYPFWSADNRYVGFFAEGLLKKYRIGGTTSEVVCEAPVGRGGTWNARDEIVFAPGTDEDLVKVSASGGPVFRVTTRDKTRGDTTHRLPQFLPDGRHFLYWAGGSKVGGDIQIASLDSPDVTSIGLSAAGATYSAGHILFHRDETLYAQAFDLDSRELASAAVRIAADVTAYSVSAAGVLAHATTRPSVPTWFDRTGTPLGTIADHGFMVALSHDDARLATTSKRGDILLFELTRPAAPSRFTTDSSHDFFPVWSPDGREVVFASTRSGRYQIFRKVTDFSREEELLLDSVPPRAVIAPTDWSRDGKYIAYTESGGSAPSNISILPPADPGARFRFRTAPARDGEAHFSPDGRWLAFTSQEVGPSGTGAVSGPEVLVAPFPGPGPVVRISDRGGVQPFWRQDGTEIFFLAPDNTLMAARIAPGRQFTVQPARKLFRVDVNQAVGFGNSYAVSSDGERFLVNALQEPRPITYVLDWLALTKK